MEDVGVWVWESEFYGEMFRGVVEGNWFFVILVRGKIGVIVGIVCL